jgi:hypothetical protein
MQKSTIRPHGLPLKSRILPGAAALILGCLISTVSYAHNHTHWPWDHNAPSGALPVFDGPEQGLDILVTGRVQEQCKFLDAPSPVNDVELQSGASLNIPFRVYCNSGFSVTLSSLHGGLASDADGLTARSRAVGFSDQASYSARFEVRRDDGSALSETCTSAQLHGGGAGCAMASGAGLRSNVPAMNQSGYLAVTMANVDPSRLLAGSYDDVLTVNVQAQL